MLASPASGRREVTVTAVYADPRRPNAVLFDVAWDPPETGDPIPWTGTSRGLPAARLYAPGWGWVIARQSPS